MGISSNRIAYTSELATMKKEFAESLLVCHYYTAQGIDEIIDKAINEDTPFCIIDCNTWGNLISSEKFLAEFEPSLKYESILVGELGTLNNTKFKSDMLFHLEDKFVTANTATFADAQIEFKNKEGLTWEKIMNPNFQECAGKVYTIEKPLRSAK